MSEEKYYKISESELKQLLMMLRVFNKTVDALSRLQEVLSDKQPINEVEICRGEVEFHSSDCFYSVGQIDIVHTKYTAILEKLAKIFGKEIILKAEIL